MTLSKTYYQIADLLEHLPEDELSLLLVLVKTRMDSIEHMKHYDPSKDPLQTGQGLFEGPDDLSERVEEMLYGDDTPAKKDEWAS